MADPSLTKTNSYISLRNFAELSIAKVVDGKSRWRFLLQSLDYKRAIMFQSFASELSFLKTLSFIKLLILTAFSMPFIV